MCGVWCEVCGVRCVICRCGVRDVGRVYIMCL